MLTIILCVESITCANILCSKEMQKNENIRQIPRIILQRCFFVIEIHQSDTSIENNKYQKNSQDNITEMFLCNRDLLE